MKVPEIKPSLSYQYTLTMYAGYHRQIYEALNALPEETRTMAKLDEASLTQYKEYVDLLTNNLSGAKASPHTLTSIPQNKERRRLARLLFWVLRSEIRTISKEHRDAALKLEQVWRPYKNIAMEKDDEFTSRLKQMQAESAAETVQAYTKKLMINGIYSRMIEASNEFESAKLLRLAAEKEYDKNKINWAKLREEIDAFTSLMFRKVYSAAEICTDAAKKEKLVDVVYIINMFTKNYVRSYKQSLTRRKLKKEKEKRKLEKKAVATQVEKLKKKMTGSARRRHKR